MPPSYSFTSITGPPEDTDFTTTNFERLGAGIAVRFYAMNWTVLRRYTVTHAFFIVYAIRTYEDASATEARVSYLTDWRLASSLASLYSKYYFEENNWPRAVLDPRSSFFEPRSSFAIL